MKWIAPVSLSPAATIYSAATVSIPSFENPERACSAGSIPDIKITASPAKRIISTEMEVPTRKNRQISITPKTNQPSNVICSEFTELFNECGIYHQAGRGKNRKN